MTPSVLEQSIDAVEDESRSAKRAKLESTPSVPSISSRLAAHSYATIDEVNADITTVVSSLTASTCGQSRAAQLKAFEDRYKDLIAKELMQNPDAFVRSSTSQPIKEEDDKKSDTWPTPERGSQTVLTLHGGLSGGRQLFSSLKQPPSENLDPSLFSNSPSDGAILEAALPNGISTTTIIPSHIPSGHEKEQEPPTLGDLCPMPSHFASLDPPKPSSQTTTRGNSVGWYKPGSPAPYAKRTGTRESYNNQTISGGQWLSYNVPPTTALQSTGEKRKQRDRALSTGEPNPELSAEDLERTRLLQEAHQQQRDAELFKCVYSSFAPSYDNSASVVSQEMKSKLWWHKVGRYKYQDVSLPEDVAAFEETDYGPYASNGAATEDEDSAFKSAVDAFGDISDANLLAFQANQGIPAAAKTGDRDVDEILQDISELLETLNSYQRNRHMSLATTTQTSAGQNKPLTELSGSPANPSDAEVNIYNMLKDQLTVIIATLPPYAVAKLDGDQLSNLNVSTRIKIESVRHKGLIQDESSKQAQAPMNNVTTPAMPARTASGPRPAGYQPATATPAQRTSYPAARPGASAYFPAGRQQAPSNSYNSYQTPQTAPAAARHAYAAQYGSGPAPPQLSQYANGGRPPMLQNGYASHGPAVPSPVPRSLQQYQQPRPNPTSYAARPPNAPGYANNYPIAAARHNSPQANAAGYTVPRPPQTPITQNSIPVNQGSPPRQPSYSGLAPNGTGSAATTAVAAAYPNRTPEEQQRLIMEHSKKIEQGRVQPFKAASLTPQPVNGQSPSRPQSNGTPGPPLSASPTPQQVNGESGS